MRHPWPSATDDDTLVAILAAMADLKQAPPPGLAAAAAAASLSGAQDERASNPVRYDVAGLLARIDRLTETNAALRGQATWFERRLNERERELRTIAQRHEGELAKELWKVEDLTNRVGQIKASPTYRVGATILRPVKKLRTRIDPTQTN